MSAFRLEIAASLSEENFLTNSFICSCNRGKELVFEGKELGKKKGCIDVHYL